MTFKINRVAIIGSGTMGSSIAALFANVGISSIMLDIVPDHLTDEEMKKGLTLSDQAVRNRFSELQKRSLPKRKPAPLTTNKNLSLIETGNLTDDLHLLKEVDWIIEVVVEKMDIKKKVLQTIDQYRRSDAIVSTNTSGLSVTDMSSHCTRPFQEHFLGTHFFNPPRYLHLLEVIPTKHTDPKITQFMKKFGEEVLGKGVVIAKDTPNFIANRIGTYGLLVTIQEMLKAQLTVGEVDSLTGPLIGRPKSATFRTLDLVGIDTFMHVASNMYDAVDGQERAVFNVPAFMKEMVDKGWLGEKTKKGFYEKTKTNGRSIIKALNVETMTFEARTPYTSPTIQRAKQIRNVKERLETLIWTDTDRVNSFLWNILKKTLLYASQHVGEIADDIVAIDEAMRWGFNWSLGPFELWDTLGVRKTVHRMEEEGEAVPKWVYNMLEQGATSFYEQKGSETYYFDGDNFRLLKKPEEYLYLKTMKQINGVIKKNNGASLIDLGDGVACLEFHSLQQAIGLDVIQMVESSIEKVTHDNDYIGLVIGNQGKHFCVGANLALMLMEAQDDNFDELEMIIRKFQQMTMMIKYAEKPVVVAPFQMTLGGGAEVALPAAHIQADSETYMGLVEFGVGLIPGGGGTKELYLKMLRQQKDGVKKDLIDTAKTVFQTIATAKVSTSAEEARELGFLNAQDGITMHRDRLLFDAKQAVLRLGESGYKRPQRELIPVVGESGYAVLLHQAQVMRAGNYATAHDVKIAERLAYVLSGGRLSKHAKISEAVMLDLEREAFLQLIGEPLTQARMQHMLVKGKPLRN